MKNKPKRKKNNNKSIRRRGRCGGVEETIWIRQSNRFEQKNCFLELPFGLSLKFAEQLILDCVFFFIMATLRADLFHDYADINAMASFAITICI